MAYTDVSGKIISRAYGKFYSLAFAAVKPGDLVARDTTNDGWILANQATGIIAEAVAIEAIAAGAYGWFAMAVEISTPATIGGRGVATDQVLCLAADICSYLYLGAAGAASSSAGGTTSQVVGVMLTTTSAYLVPATTLSSNLAVGGTLAVTGATTLSSTLAVTGLITATGGLKSATGKPIISGMVVCPLTTVTALASGATATYAAAAIVGGLIVDTPTAACAATTDTAAAIIALIPGYVVGSSFLFTIKNTSAGAYTITLGAGANVTLLGTMTIAQNYLRMFQLIITGANAVTIYSLGTDAY